MFSDPKHNIEQFMIGEGTKVADFGAGSGHYTIEAAKAVGDSGFVYAVEIQRDLLDRVKNLAREKNLHNVEVLWGDLEKIGGSGLGDSSVNSVIVSNILFQIENKEDFIKEAARVLKPGGKLLLVDWTDSFGGMGPAPEMVVSEDVVTSLFKKNGFIVDKNIYAGEHHFGKILRKE